MYLTAPNLLYYLRSRGLVSAENVISDGFVVIESRRRNRNYRVRRGEQSPLFVKQVPMAVQETMSSLKREAECYRLAKEHPDFTPLLPFVPHLIDYNAANHTIVTEFLPGAENLNEFYTRVGSFPERLAGLIGKALSECHRWSSKIVPSLDAAKVFPRTTPWMFTFLQNAETTMPAMSEGTKQAVALMRQHPEFVSGLAAMKTGWLQLCLIHGDIKWDNFLTTEHGDTLKIIDWELADIGDPSWDIAGVLAAYLQTFILAEAGFPAMTQGPAQLASRRLQDLWPAIGAFWTEYASGMHWTSEQANMELARAVYFCAGRLLLTGIEMHINAPYVYQVLHGLIRYAAQIFNNPYQAGKDLFGISDTIVIPTNGKASLGQDVTSELAHAALTQQAVEQKPADLSTLSPDIVKRLTAIFENVKILSPLSFQFADEEPVVLSPGAPVNPLFQTNATAATASTDPAYTKQYLIEALWPVLYLHCYTKTYLGGSVKSTSASTKELPSPDQEFIATLSNANAGHTHWDRSWEVYRLGVNGAIHVKKGDAYRLCLPGQYAFTGNPGQVPQVGSRVDLLAQSESTTAQTGFYYAFGERLSSEFDDAQLCRIYFAATAAAAAPIISFLSRELNDFKIPYQFKCLNSRSAYTIGRTDAAVLYISKRFLEIVLRIIAEGYETFSSYLLKETPLFSKQLFEGIGLADEPGDGKSFGQSRIYLVCKGIVEAWYNGKTDVRSRFDSVANQFALAGISLKTPYLNDGNVDQYNVIPYPSEKESA